MITNSRYEDAQQLVAAVKEFSPDAKVVMDPSSPQTFGDEQFDEDLGMKIIPVPPGTELASEGPFCVYGHVSGLSLAIPQMDEFSKNYTIFSGLKCVFIQNVGDFKADYQKLLKQSSSGHPLYQNGIKFGTNVVARGDDGNKVVVLLWSAHKYNELQERA